MLRRRALRPMTRARACGALATSLPQDFDYQWLVEEIKTNLPRELDFTHEAANAERCRANLRSKRSTVGNRCASRGFTGSRADATLPALPARRRRARTELAPPRASCHVGGDAASPSAMGSGVTHLRTSTLRRRRVHIPHIHHDKTAPRVLTMEFVEGAQVRRSLLSPEPTCVSCRRALDSAAERQLCWVAWGLGEECLFFAPPACRGPALPCRIQSNAHGLERLSASALPCAPTACMRSCGPAACHSLLRRSREPLAALCCEWRAHSLHAMPCPRSHAGDGPGGSEADGRVAGAAVAPHQRDVQRDDLHPRRRARRP